jgi:hypothetical protein
VGCGMVTGRQEVVAPPRVQTLFQHGRRPSRSGRSVSFGKEIVLLCAYPAEKKRAQKTYTGLQSR